jgi:energy-converting hydrogenase B subunit D
VILLDVLLGLTIVLLAVGALIVRDSFTAVVLFIIYGMILAITWSRLYAVDVALAEAAIGAGITGALLLEALGATRSFWRSSGNVHEQGKSSRL